MQREDRGKLGVMRLCGTVDQAEVLYIINAAADAYRGAIPADCWHEPYMSDQELTEEIADGVVFSGCELDQKLVGVMGVQRRRNVDLIRHAYVMPSWQGHGIGSALLSLLQRGQLRPLLVGTWRAAIWAIRFYEQHGFALAPDEYVAPLLQTYWKVPERQVATSVVLSSPSMDNGAAAKLIIEA